MAVFAGWVVLLAQLLLSSGEPWIIRSLAALITTLVLWVAAIDVNRPESTDISHPAFYLEGQELESGNMRGFSALDVCKADGATCEGGDESCNGFCRSVEQSDGSVAAQCVPPPASCANETERCKSDADCCNAPSGTKCINQACTTPPRQRRSDPVDSAAPVQDERALDGDEVETENPGRLVDRFGRWRMGYRARPWKKVASWRSC